MPRRDGDWNQHPTTIMPPRRATTRSKKAGRERIAQLIDEATVDCYSDDEFVAAWHAAIDSNLDVPFATIVLGVEVEVTGIDLDASGQIVATCTRGKLRQNIPILDLPLATPRPGGSEWIDAYRAWVSGGY